MKNNTLVFYHANCIDGFTAAAVAFLALGFPKSAAKFVPVKYEEREQIIEQYLPLLKSKEFQNVYILDFSFSYKDTLLLNEHSEAFVWLDHHQTALDMWAGEGSKEAVDGFYDYSAGSKRIILNRNKCGAMLAWDYFMPSHLECPELIKIVNDYDLWQFKLPQTKGVIAALELELPKARFELWQGYFNNWPMIRHTSMISELLDVGAYIQAAKEAQIKLLIESTKRKCVIDGLEGLICNLPKLFASEVGAILAKESGTFGATYYTDDKGITCFSLRSVGDFDVAQIAQKFGGGGHKNSAGFALKITQNSGEGVVLWSVE